MKQVCIFSFCILAKIANLCSAQSPFDLRNKFEGKFKNGEDSLQIIVQYSCDFIGETIVYYKNKDGVWNAEFSELDIIKEYGLNNKYKKPNLFYEYNPKDSVRRTTIIRYGFLKPKKKWSRIEKKFKKLLLDSINKNIKRKKGFDGCTTTIIYRDLRINKIISFTSFDLEYWYNYDHLLLPRYKILRNVRKTVKIKRKKFNEYNVSNIVTHFISKQ